MNWLRFRYFISAVIFLGIAVALAYGLEPGGTPMTGELLVFLGLIFFYSFLMGRNPEREEETAGILSYEDDD
jgi:uncharacterized membrane protein YobD (UPF0266 family)